MTQSQRQRLPYYASLGIRDSARVRKIRDEVWSALNPPSSYEKVEPHITLHPGFTCDHRTASRAVGVLTYVIGDKVDVSGVSYWPSEEEPVVVKLDLNADLSVYRQALESHVRQSGGTIDREPVPAHMTLFKDSNGGDNSDELLDDSWPVRLSDIAGRYGGWTSEIGGLSIKRRG